MQAAGACWLMTVHIAIFGEVGALQFLRYEERIIPVRASALIPPRQLRARPTLSPKVFPEIVIK